MLTQLSDPQVALVTKGCLQNQLSAGFLSRLGAWSYLINDANRQRHSSGSSLNTSREVMALTAVIRGLKEIPIPSAINITVASETVMNGATLWLYAWKNNNWTTFTGQSIENRELWQELEDRIDFHKKVTWTLTSGSNLTQETNFVEKLCLLKITSVICGL